MMMGFFNHASPLAAAFLFASAAVAQVALYGQCGGTGYTGSSTCVAGAVCQSQNEFYAQCLQGTATSVATARPTTTALSSASVSKSTSSLTSRSSSSTLVTSVVKVPTSSSLTVKATQSTTAGAAPGASSAPSTGTKYLMIFGDSYSSDGFWAGSSIPSASQPLGVSLPGTTTSGGLNWVGVSATQLNSSLTLAFDYAEYGASTDKTLVRGATHDLVAQVNEFQTYTAHNASDIAWTSANTMAVVWLGINDVGNSFWDGFATPFDLIMDQYFRQLQYLYDAGIRTFTLFTVPPFEQAPVFIGQPSQSMSYVRSNISTYNEDLVTRLARFKSANSGVTGTVFNTSASFLTALSNPTAYGAADATCMNSDGKACLWYDNYHPGQAIQKLVAQNFVAALKGTFF
ncbi:fungal cellulose binding domain-containing protein [Phlyctema vagabunda]|uniref:Fungal cellulose binding domain-containing protein n=1 Tax=Phlyctema vagabunda TaxID=108571 RepID=A0ABR4PFV3_9HELO